MREQSTAARSCAVDLPITRVDAICREHVLIEFLADHLPTSHPGQFLEIRCGDEPVDDGPRIVEWTDGGFPSCHDPDFVRRDTYLRRPFSIADRWIADDGRARMTVISRAIGPGTRWLDRRRQGDTLNVTGPLGRGFRLDATQRPVVLVGGGVGIPPLIYLARELHTAGVADMTVLFGVTSGELLPVRLTGEPAHDAAPRPCLDLPGAPGVPAIITTDDGTLGLRGNVSDGLTAWHTLRRAAAPNVADDEPGAAAIVCACGPERMLEAIARQTRVLGLACQLCIERNMGCGLGTCLSCVVRVRDASRPAGWRWALSCSEGPVFERDVLFDPAD